MGSLGLHRAGQFVTRHSLATSLIAAALAIVWSVAILLVDGLSFVVFHPNAKSGVEIILGLASLFVALVLGLFPSARDHGRLSWVVAGFLCLGFGSLVFGYVEPLISDAPDLNSSMYSALVVRTLATLLLVAGLWPRSVRRLSPSWIIGIPPVVISVALLVHNIAGALPVIAEQADVQMAAQQNAKILSGLTAWHWTLFSIPLALSAAAMAGAARHYPGRAFNGWLVLALAILMGSNWHTLFWPSGYTPIVTTSTLMRLAFTGIVIAGGVLELRQISNERAATLAAANQYAQRVTELATFKADFMAIVAHELTTPLSAMRRYTDLLPMLGTPPDRQRVIDAMHNELDMLATLVADVHSIADVERADFHIERRPVAAAALLHDAAQFARTLPGDHPVSTACCDVEVSADPERIGQVLRNLVSNAAKYSPPEAPIELCAQRRANHVWFEVIDYGYGIPAGELQRIFDKFERGRDPRTRQIAGAGLGLYLSRKILEAHGAHMTVASSPGNGSAFRFSLEVAS